MARQEPIPRDSTSTMAEGLARPSLSGLAELVAAGQLPFPVDLSGPEVAELARLVRERRRERLLALVAQVIAADLARDEPRRI
jgi:hypothetical protein